jgi:hemerythrin-like domain-containing protein
MLTTIGRGGPTRPELWQSLLDCHQRIRRFTQIARQLGQPSPVEEVAEAAAALQRYFTVALPLHAADEDQSIAPRLVAVVPELAELLERMTAEHAPLHQTVADLLPLWQAITVEPARQAELAPRLLAPAAWLGELFEPHLRVEEELIFPVMSERLTPAVTAQILAEQRARRNR